MDREYEAGLNDESLWIAVFLELLGTTILLFIITAVLINVTEVVPIAFVIGIAIATLAHSFGPIKGAHFSPAVTIGEIVTGDITVIKAMLYITAQLIGGCVGSAITYGLTPPDHFDPLGNVAFGKGYSVTQGFLVELLLTGVLVFAFLAATSNDNSRKYSVFINAVTIGLSMTLVKLIGIPYTGVSGNPARTFGPAFVWNLWHSYHWIYLLGPVCGAIVAALIYRFFVEVKIEQPDEITDEQIHPST